MEEHPEGPYLLPPEAYIEDGAYEYRGRTIYVPQFDEGLVGHVIEELDPDLWTKDDWMEYLATHFPGIGPFDVTDIKYIYGLIIRENPFLAYERLGHKAEENVIYLSRVRKDRSSEV